MFCKTVKVKSKLIIIEKCLWETDSILAIKRIIIVSFPASMNAAVSDSIK